MAVEYITSKNLFLLICDTLKLMDESLVKHGMRVAYIMSKMLECKGKYEKYEIADFTILAVLHDIGAYKTDDVRKQLTYEAKNPYPHSIYGYMFLKYLSPLEEQSKMLLYHHVDTKQMETVSFPYKEEAEILKVAEIMDIWQKAFGDKFQYRMIEKYQGTKYSKEAIELLYQAVEKYNIFEKLQNGEYQQEFQENLEYVLLSDDEKEKYVRMLMYCTGLKDESMVTNTISTICVCNELGKKLRISEAERNEIYYAALLHDVGMLTIPHEILNAPRKLEEAEINLIHTHVTVMEEILKGKVSDRIISIVAAHHERFDGSGYPRGLKGSAMYNSQAILQTAEVVVNLNVDKPYRKAFTKDEIITELNNSIVSGNLEGIVADTLLRNYDEIMEKASLKAQAVLRTHQKLQQNSEKVYKNFTK